MAFTYDLFSNTSEGFEEHFQITSEDIVSLIADRASLIKGVVESGGQPRVSGPKSYNKPAQGNAKPAGPMEAAAAQVFGTPVSVECPNGCGEMRFVKGGFSERTNKPYPAFYSCRQCGTKQNAPKA